MLIKKKDKEKKVLTLLMRQICLAVAQQFPNTGISSSFIPVVVFEVWELRLLKTITL